MCRLRLEFTLVFSCVFNFDQGIFQNISSDEKIVVCSEIEVVFVFSGIFSVKIFILPSPKCHIAAVYKHKMMTKFKRFSLNLDASNNDNAGFHDVVLGMEELRVNNVEVNNVLQLSLN